MGRFSFVMRYGTNKEKNTKLGEKLIKMTGKGERWHTKVVGVFLYQQNIFTQCDILGWGKCIV